VKVAIYAWVSTLDKDQDQETQLMPLQDFCLAQGWEVYQEYVDQAPANDLAHRTQ
jgi:DNA invertase Pin-like site-specific DNA recombinase